MPSSTIVQIYRCHNSNGVKLVEIDAPRVHVQAVEWIVLLCTNLFVASGILKNALFLCW